MTDHPRDPDAEWYRVKINNVTTGPVCEETAARLSRIAEERGDRAEVVREAAL